MLQVARRAKGRESRITATINLNIEFVVKKVDRIAPFVYQVKVCNEGFEYFFLDFLGQSSDL